MACSLLTEIGPFPLRRMGHFSVRAVHEWEFSGLTGAVPTCPRIQQEHGAGNGQSGEHKVSPQSRAWEAFDDKLHVGVACKTYELQL
jgi:hypothetical protein